MSKSICYSLVCLLVLILEGLTAVELQDELRDSGKPRVCVIKNSTGLPAHRDDCALPLTGAKVLLLSHGVDQILTEFTEAVTASPATRPTSGKEDRSSQPSIYTCVGSLKDSLSSISRYLRSAASCLYEGPEAFQLGLSQAKRDFEIVKGILCQLKTYIPKYIRGSLEMKFELLTIVVENAITVSEKGQHAGKCNSSRVPQAFHTLQNNREELITQNNLMSQTVQALREEVNHQYGTVLRTLADLVQNFDRVIRNTREELEEMKEYVDRVRRPWSEESTSRTDHGVQIEVLIDHLRSEVDFLKDFSLLGKGVISMLRMLEETLYRYKSSTAEAKHQAYLHLLEVVRMWLRKYTHVADPATLDSSLVERGNTPLVFVKQTEDLVFMLTKINAVLSTGSSSIDTDNREGWLAFLEEHFDPLMVKLVTGHWFTLASHEFLDENLCFQYHHRFPEGVWAVSKKVTSYRELRSKCLWKLVPMNGQDGKDWLYLQNKLNSSDGEETFRLPNKVNIRLLELEKLVLVSGNEIANESSVADLSVAIFSLQAAGINATHNFFTPTSNTSITYNRYGREIWFGKEEDVDFGDNVWKLKFEE